MQATIMASSALLHRVLSLPPSLRRSLFTAASSPNVYDVVCIGGGPAGLSFITALQSHPLTRGLKVALVDSQSLNASSPDPTSTSYSNRCSSLTPSSARFLESIGAWRHLVQQRTQPYHGMEVWDGVSGSKIQFDPLDTQGTSMLDNLAELVPGSRFRESRRHHERSAADRVVATMCENVNLNAALLSQMRANEAWTVVYDNTKVEGIQFGPEPENEAEPDFSQWPVVKTAHGDLFARLLVGADGANSPVRTFAGIPSHGWDYNQHGVVATLSLSYEFTSADLRMAYQRFLPTGPIALLPLPDNKATLVWSTTPQLASRLKQLNSTDFVAMVNAALRLLPVDINFLLMHSVGELQGEVAWRSSSTSAQETGLPIHIPRVASVQDGTVASFPLRMRHASTYTGHRIALIGDAAHTMHPLAGQGLNLGLADAESLANQVTSGLENGMDIGTSWCLDGYNKDRWAANNAMLGVVDKLQKLYSASSGPVVWGRSLGLDLINKLGPVKGMLMGAAAGSR